MKIIKLTQNQETVVDDDLFEYLSKFSWSARYNKCTHSYYALSNEKINNRWRTILMHRVIFQAPKGVEVDHKNGDTLCNLKSNLRLATRKQNSQNRKIGNGNTSGYKGVTWYKSSKKWRSQIQINGKKVSLGYFDDIIDAAKAYDICAKTHFGEFARLNFPNE